MLQNWKLLKCSSVTAFDMWNICNYCLVHREDFYKKCIRSYNYQLYNRVSWLSNTALYQKYITKITEQLYCFRTIGPRSKVWCEKEMVDLAAYEFAEVCGYYFGNEK